MDFLFQQLINGLMLGATFSLLAIGYTLVFGLLKLLNMAHGEVYMLGAFFGWALVTFLKLPIYLALIGAFAIGGILGIIIEFFCFRLVNKDYPLASMLSTIGIGVILQNFALVFSGGEMVRFPEVLRTTNFTIGSVIISEVHLVILGIALFLMIMLNLLISKTKLGKSMRAVAEDGRIASMYGINVNIVTMATFFISSSLAGITGVLTALAYHSITPFMGVEQGLKGLAVIVLGGLGSVSGAMAGGIILGLAEVFAIAYLPADFTGYKDAIAFALLIGILLFKPTGLFGKYSLEEKV
jgi:branched-chain amino acid transport system permease protein